MIRLGFDRIWVDLILRCISTTSFSVNINGDYIRNFSSSRGLRQGDPLSPYLFLFVAEGLSNLISRANIEGKLSGLRVSNSPSISHLLFADDSLIFCKADERELVVLKELLNLDENASGEYINFSKSAILFSQRVNQDRRVFLSRILGVNNVDSFGNYQGVPSVFSRSKAKDFSYVLDKVWKSVQGWKSSFFSLAGKEVLIKCVGQSYPYVCYEYF